MEERGVEAEALLVQARIIGAQQRADARAAFDRAVIAAASLGARPLLAHAHLSLGRWLERQGESEAARGHLESAERAFGALAMAPWWPEPSGY
jgi:hypothetical protein